MVGEAGLEPAKLTQGIYSPPPLPLGTFPHALKVSAGRLEHDLFAKDKSKIEKNLFDPVPLVV